MIVNVCASSISREPAKHYLNYYYTITPERKTSKPSTGTKAATLRENVDKSLSVKEKAKRILQKIRRLIVGKIGKTSLKV